MSDSLTDAQKIIAEVMDAHRTKARWGNPEDRDFGLFQCSCGHLGETIKSTDGFMRARSDHLAVEIDKALGGLTRERSFGIVSYSASAYQVRFVGGWTPEEES